MHLSLRDMHNMPKSSFCENMTSSTKPEVHNLLQHHHSQHAQNMWRNSAMYFPRYARGQTKGQKDILITIFHIPPWGKVITQHAAIISSICSYNIKEENYHHNILQICNNILNIWDVPKSNTDTIFPYSSRLLTQHHAH